MDHIAIISDLHGNMQGLEAVLADIGARGITRILCLGDLVGKGPDGAAVIDRCRETCEVTVQGNWDAMVAWEGDLPQNLWHRAQIGPERCDYLSRLPGSFDFLLSGQHVRLFHASSTSIYHRVRMLGPQDEHNRMFENTPFTGDGPLPDIVGYGDLHVAFSMSFTGKTLFNTGSVGNPLDLPLASYAVLAGNYGSATAADWQITLHRVRYDIEAAIDAGYASGMPEADAYANELRTARYRGLTLRQPAD
jgi:predicted phosphodiesterase